MQAGLRIFEESLEQRIPLIIDASVDSNVEAPKLDLMLTKLAQGFGLAQEELVRLRHSNSSRRIRGRTSFDRKRVP